MNHLSTHSRSCEKLERNVYAHWFRRQRLTFWARAITRVLSKIKTLFTFQRLPTVNFTNDLFITIQWLHSAQFLLTALMINDKGAFVTISSDHCVRIIYWSQHKWSWTFSWLRNLVSTKPHDCSHCDTINVSCVGDVSRSLDFAAWPKMVWWWWVCMKAGQSFETTFLSNDET